MEKSLCLQAYKMHHQMVSLALNDEQKAKLLAVLKKHEALFQGKRSNWKGQPVSI
jgi:hypothetical protein